MENEIFFYDKIKILEVLENSNQLSKLHDDQILKLIKKIKANNSLFNYFANNINNVSLVERIYKLGFFDELPSKDGGQYKRNWIEGFILVRKADSIPEIIKLIVKKIKTDNSSIYSLLLQSVMKLNTQDKKELWPHLISWLESCEWHYLPDAYIKILEELNANNFGESTFDFFKVICKPEIPIQHEKENFYQRCEATGKFHYYEFESTIIPFIVTLNNVKVLSKLTNLLKEYLIESIEIECKSKNSDFCKTSFWRSAIEHHEQDQINKNHKDVLLNLLRVCLEQRIKMDSSLLGDEIIEYLKSDHIILKRLAIHLIRISQNIFLEKAFELLIKPEIYEEDENCHHEIFLLLRDGYKLFDIEKQKQILNVIMQGPKTEIVDTRAKWHLKNYPNSIGMEEYKSRYINIWIRDRLQMIEEFLENPELAFYKKLITQFSKNDHPEFTHYTKCGFVSFKAPIEKEEWDNLSAEKCIEYMIDFKPSEKQDDFLSRISPKGFANLFSNSLSERYSEFSDKFSRLVDQSKFSIYVTTLLDHHRKVLDECTAKKVTLDKCYNLELIVEIINLSSIKWSNNKSYEDSIEGGFKNSVLISALNLISEIINYIHINKINNNEIFENLKVLLLEFCKNEDPSEEIDSPKSEYQDPITISINHIRPMALRELMRYSVAYSVVSNKKVWLPEVKEMVENMLYNDKALSVRAVFGEAWSMNWFCFLDEAWARENHNKVFSEKEDIYFITAWDSYIIHLSYCDDPCYDLMRPLYIKAIDNANKNKLTRTHLEPDRRLISHLVGFLRFEIEKMNFDSQLEQDNPLDHLFSLEPNNLHSHFAWCLWRTCSELKDEKELKALWEKIKKLWMFRLKSDNKFSSEELGWYVSILDIEILHVAPFEVEQLLTKTIPYLSKENNLGVDGLINYLVKSSDKNIKFSIEKLYELIHFQGAGKYSGWYSGSKVELILKNSLSAKWEVKKRAVEIIHKLGEYGEHWARGYLEKLR